MLSAFGDFGAQGSMLDVCGVELLSSGATLGIIKHSLIRRWVVRLFSNSTALLVKV